MKEETIADVNGAAEETQNTEDASIRAFTNYAGNLIWEIQPKIYKDFVFIM